MKFLKQLAPHAHWVLRITMAAIFIYHGQMKFGMGIDKFADAMHLPYFIALLVPLAEIGGSIFILVGGFYMQDLLTRLAGFFFAAVMVGAIVLVKWNGGWSKMEFEVALLAIALYMLIAGKCVGGVCKK